MSRRHKIKYLSSDELKSKLYAHFQKTGSLDHLRTQLRGQLVSELFKVAEPIDVDKFPDASDVDKCLLPIQVCNWLVYDHLSRQDYQYSLSTFVTEAQLPYPEKFLTAGDILRLLGLDHNTSEFLGISKLYSEKNELEYLHSLLLAILKTLFNIPKKDNVLNQTHNQESEVNDSQIRKGNNDQDLNQSFIKDKGSVLDASFRDEFSKSKDLTLDRSFQSNFDIKSTDLSFQEQLQSVKKESEREVQKLRHKLLEELENLHSQEHKMQLEVEFTKSELKREQYKLTKEKEMLKEKEVLLEKEITNKYEMKMRDAESEFASKLHFKDKEIQSLKAKLIEKEQKLAQVETELLSEKDNHNLMKRELEDLKHMYKIIQDKYSAVLDENTNLLKKFENMSDYSILKEELSSKTSEVLRLQNEIRDIHHRSEVERKKYVETVRNLEENLSMKEPQLNQTRRELEQVQNTYTSEKSLWNKERKKLEQELSEFKELYKTVIQKMEDQKEDIQDLHQTIHVLNYKLTNNVINLTKSESVRPYKSIHTSTRTSLQSKTENFTKSSTYLQPSNEKYDDSSMKFLSDAKSRFGKLKQEEDAIQEKYSYIFSSIPDFNNHSQSYLGNYSVSAPKSNFKSYSFMPLSKSANVNSSFNFNNWTKNKMTSDICSPYSLNDVKRMVSNSLFSHKSRNHIDSLTNIGNADMSSTVPNTLSSNFKDIRQASGLSLPFSTNIRSSFPLSNENVPTLNTETNKHLRNELSTEVLNQFGPHIAGSDSSTVNQPGNSHSQKLHDFVELESKDPYPVQNSKRASTQKENDFVKETVDNSEHSQLESESTEKNLPEELSPPSIHADKNIISLSSVPRSMDSQSKSIVLEASESASLYTAQEISDNKIVEKTKSIPEASSLFVNLDAAWKQRSLDPLLPAYTKSVTTEVKSDNPITSSYLANIGTNVLKNTILYTVEKGTDNLPMEKTAIFSAKTVEAETTGISPEMSSNTQVTAGSKSTEMASSKQIIESSEVTEMTSNKQITEVSEATDAKDSSLKESEIHLGKQIEHDDKIYHTDNDEKQSEKSEKIASADSLSELSDVHLSCGSEAEQQKEDSDAW